MLNRLTLPIPYPSLNQRGLPQIGLFLFVISLGFGLALLPLKIAVVAVLGGLIFVLSLLYPKMGLYLLIPAIPFSSLLQVNLGIANIGPIEGLLALMLATWLIKMAAKQEIIIPHPPMLWPFLVFLGVVGLSWLTTFSLAASLTETIKWVEMLALYLFIMANFTRQESRWLVVALLLAGLAQAGLGIYQFVFKAGPEGFLLFGGRFLRAYGTFRQPNPYAGYLGLILPLALSTTLWGIEEFIRKQTATAVFWTFLAGSAFGGMLIALFASQSRGAWIGFIVAVVITIFFKGGKWTAALTAGLISGAILVSMGVLAFLPSSITQRFTDVIPYIGLGDVSTVIVTDANFAAIERLAHWQAAAGMWLEHLWLGVGFGNYQAIYPAYAVGRWLDPLGHAHNYILNIGAEAGLVGVIGYFIFWGWITALTIRGLIKTSPNSLYRAVVVGNLGIMSHLHVHNLFDNLYVQGMYLHLTVIFALISLAEIKKRD